MRIRRFSPVPSPATSSVLALFILTFLTTVFCSPHSSSTPTLSLAQRRQNAQNAQNAPRASKPFLLRVMPLGASITVGYQSSDGNGYRKFLREQLRFAGWEVDMVGSLANGTMKDNQNEGHFGKTIDQVANAAVDSAHLQPNVVLINVGTNDGIQNVHITGAGERIDRLIDDLIARIPNTTIILSTLIPNTEIQRVVERLSKEYRGVAARRRAQGDSVVLAEMSYFVSSSKLVDGTHPNDEGYKEMAAVWWDAIETAEQEGMLARPNKVPGTAVAAVQGGNGTSSEGRGLDDGPVEDPDLPYYIAPPQPGETSLASSLRVGLGYLGYIGYLWLLFGVVFWI